MICVHDRRKILVGPTCKYMFSGSVWFGFWSCGALCLWMWEFGFYSRFQEWVRFEVCACMCVSVVHVWRQSERKRKEVEREKERRSRTKQFIAKFSPGKRFTPGKISKLSCLSIFPQNFDEFFFLGRKWQKT